MTRVPSDVEMTKKYKTCGNDNDNFCLISRSRNWRMLGEKRNTKQIVLFLTIVVVIFPLVDQGVGDLATSYSLNVLNTEAAVRRCSSK